MLAIDSDPFQLHVHKLNHLEARHVLLELGDDLAEFVRKIQIFVRAAVPEGEVWHLHASPPCQGFSKAGGRTVRNRDGKRCLTAWTASLIEALDPPSWSLENVPPCLAYLKANCACLLSMDGVRVFQNAFGWEHGAPVLRKRLLIGKGFDLSKRIYEREEDVGLRRFLPYLEANMHVKNEVTNRWMWNKVTKRREKGRRWRPEQGELMRSVDRPTYTPRASNRNQIWQEVEKGTFRSVRILTVREVSVIQGFPADYVIPERMKEAVAVFYTDVEGEEKIKIKVRPTKGTLTTGFGNSVCPPITRAMLSTTH